MEPQNFDPEMDTQPKKKSSGWLIGCATGVVVTICVVTFVLVGGFAGFRALFLKTTEGFTASVSAPSSQIDVSESFQVTVQISNTGSEDINTYAIKLPNSLIEGASLTNINPPGVPGANDGSQTTYSFASGIAEGGTQTVVFSFTALQPGEIRGVVEVIAGTSSVSNEIRVLVTEPATAPEEVMVEPEDQPIMGDVIPYRSVVQIIALVEMDGQLVEGWSGSGTIISEDGLILTNAHVILSDRYYNVVDLVVAITMEQDAPPVKMFFADVIQADARLDLAVIKVRSDLNGAPANFSSLGIEPVPLGNSDSLGLGDEIIIIGYPGIGGQTITLTRGEVSGFTSEEPYGNRAFIKTSATIAGGNSGGLAANAQGEIIGIPSQVGSGDLEGLIVDCRPLADTNRDGVIDQRDNCVPTGGFINALRPVDLAQTLIEAALAGQVAIQEDQEPEEHQEYEHEGEVVLYDDFSDNRHDWYVGEYNEGSVDIVGGQLEINVDVAKTYIFTHLPDVYSDVILAVDGRVLQPTGDGDFGFVCGYVDDQNYTVLEISEDGYYAIWALINDELRYLEEWSPSDLIPSSGPITLAAYCGADGFALAVNDTLLVDVDASHYRPGRVGLFTGTWNQANIRVGFDEFWILTP